ncbi:PREDICTED: serine/threonine-protein phosphatase 6 regulatory ankyrin repeat subunit B-like [Camelina sativa]|uniref:Serine/threonine-protein phosphatase 6 regulatory ankyrin repeat subunit B-like n=1 Tax=Camelina sativa TaxID=90675 RepID=A0ABM0U4G2_CAMSA|nr:PREDICTED: serine/threonine-protein phosphatase 6 regulatory ankyrin repeat subunit B-like [Camelina sativa]
MPPTYFPLRWESTGDQWWYATPIDYAAANCQYDLVRELLRIDSNNLMKLTSLRRIRRLETVWDDDSLFHDVSACRSRVAKKLLSACDEGGSRSKSNTLIRSGYGGWLMYTAASAGDLSFVRDLLDRNPLLVFGEGEYGVTDILYAAARSKNDHVFRLIYDFAVAPRFGFDQQSAGDIPAAYKWEMKNRAVHSASRGGNLNLLKELVSDCSVEDVLAFRDKQGSTILHAASAKGNTLVVKELVALYGLVEAVDNQGNTALHVAAYRGHADLVDALIFASPSLIHARNNAGDTFLHAGISGFQAPAFERLDKHTDLMNRLITSAASKSPGDFVNYRNNEGRTALHLAISGNVPLEFVEMLMSVKSIDINVRDSAGMTPLDLIRQKPLSPTSDLLFRRLVSAGGMFSSRDQSITSVVASHLKDRGNFYSPGARFKTSDADMFLSTRLDVAPDKIAVARHVRSSSCSIEIGQLNVMDEDHHFKKCRNASVNSATERLKSVFHWPRVKKQPGHSKNDSEMSIASTALEAQETPVPLRQRFSKSSSTGSLALPNSNKRTLSVRSNQSSPRARKKRIGTVRSRSSSFSKISIHSSSTSSTSGMVDLKQKGVMMDASIAGPSSGLNRPAVTEQGKSKLNEKKGSLRRRLKSHYFCFGASALSVKTPTTVLV